MRVKGAVATATLLPSRRFLVPQNASRAHCSTTGTRQRVCATCRRRLCSTEHSCRCFSRRTLHQAQLLPQRAQLQPARLSWCGQVESLHEARSVCPVGPARRRPRHSSDPMARDRRRNRPPRPPATSRPLAPYAVESLSDGQSPRTRSAPPPIRSSGRIDNGQFAAVRCTRPG